MKKILIGIITFITIFSLSITAYAAESSVSVPYYAQTPGAANASNSIKHTHTGSNGSGCYTNKVISSYSKSCTQSEHSHSGDTTNGGPCYQTANTSTKWYSWTSSSSSGSFGTHCSSDWTDLSDTRTTYRCSGCGATSTYTVYSCGHTSGSSKSGNHCSSTYVSSYSKSCNISEHSHWGGNGTGCYQTPNYSYNLGCGFSTSSVVGNGYITPSTTAITTSLTLTASIKNANGLTISSYKWNTGATSAAITVTSPGTYTCTITYVEKGTAKTTSLSYNVNNISHQIGKLTVSANKTTWTPSLVLTASSTTTAIDNITNISYSWKNSAGTVVSSASTATITNNDTYTCTMSYKEGGVARSISCNYVVDQIDNSAPQVTVSVQKSDPVQDNNSFTVVGTDNITSNLYYNFQNQGWEQSTSGKTYTVIANGTYTVQVKDDAGNITTKTVTIENITNIAPTVNSIIPNTTEMANEVILTVNATMNKSPGYTGLTKLYYSLDGLNWQESNEFTIVENGDYTIYVKDIAGNQSSKLYGEISNIDDIPPEVNVIYNYSKWELEKTVVVNAFDAGMGLTDTPYRYSVDGANWTEWTNDNTYKVTANGTYYVEVQDKSDLITKVSYEITHIDREVPNVELNYDDSWGTSKTLVIKANDSKSGLHKFPYRFYNGLEWTDWSEITAYSITKNGTYSVEVRDILENTYTNSININTIDDIAPIIENIEIPDGPSKDKEVKINAKDDGVGLASNAYSYSTDGTNWSNWTSKDTYTMNKNGTLYVKVKDSVGNIVEASKEVNGIDNEAPNAELVYDNEKPEQTKKITVKTNEKDLSYKICIDGIWSEWGNKGEWEVSKNLTYKVQVKDKAGNITSLIANITSIDSTKPIIKITFDEDNLSQNKIVKVEVEDDNLPENFIRINGGEWTNITTFEFTKNGIYTIEVRDIAGNITSYTFEIKSIVNEGPEIRLVYDNTKWERTKIASIELINPVFDVDSYQYSFYTKEGWQPYSKNNSVELTENGIYAVKIRDGLANITTFEYEITKIDNIVPEVELVYDKESFSTEVSIEIKANDKESGVTGKAYRYYITEWSDWSSDNTFTLEQNGAFAVEVQDAVGNIASIKENLNIIDTDAPEVELYVDEKTNTIKVIAKDYGSGLANEAYKWNNEDWTNLAIREFEDLDNITIEVRDSVGNSIVLNSKSIKKGFTVNQLNNENANQVSKKFKEVASTAAGIIGCSALVIFLFLYFKPKPKIGVMRNNIFNEVCSADVKVKAYWVEVEITQAIIDKAQSESLTILFNDSFVKKHRSKSLRVILPEEEITMKLEKIVEL